MVLNTRLLLLLLLSQDVTELVECNEKVPKKCYTCSSLVTSRLCGDNFQKLNFLVKDCAPDKKYCMKLLETAGGSTFSYRKCTSNSCEQETKVRSGQVSDCNICTSTLCNDASTLHLAATLFSAVLWHYLLNT